MGDETINRAGFILEDKSRILLDFYDLETKALGSGSYGQVCKATPKSKIGGKTTAVRACKAMAKKNIKNENRFREEIRLMKEMDHPNIIRLYETFEDHNNIYLILEICTGGELFDVIVSSGLLPEKKAARLVKAILSAIYYMHEHQIMHRDLKPENFLFASTEENAPLKVIDFGLGAKFEKGQRMTTKAGTPYYVSPQVLKGNYTEACDIWSIGVIAFILLSGYPPFYGDKDSEILARVRKGQFEFPNEQDDGFVFSVDAKDIITKMLTFDESARISAKSALAHKWLADQNREEHDSKHVNPKAIGNFKNFHGAQKFKKLALTAIATQLNEKEIKTLKETFISLDKNSDGTLTLQEIKEGCANAKISLPAGFEQTFGQIDTDKSGCIDYTEFIAATMDTSLQYREDLCWSAFRVFDKDGDGKITPEELATALGEKETANTPLDLHKVKAIIEKYDTNNDGQIDFQEFMAMMKESGSC